MREGYPDATAFDPKHDHYDAESRRSDPRWYVVDVKLERKFKRLITLDKLRQHAADELSDLIVLRRGNRLSVTPVSKPDWDFVLSLE
jgi:predicted RNA-binding protein with PUA-like domain